MTPFAALSTGGAAGFAGASLAHVVTALLDRAGSETWLKGPYGPPFFNISLYTGVFYAAVGAGASRRAREAALGFAGPFLAIALPMTVLTRVARFGVYETAPSIEWKAVVSVVYLLAIWGTIAGLGAASVSGRRGLGAAAAVVASLSAYGLLEAFMRLVPSYAKSPWDPTALIPSPINLMDGILSGAALSLAVFFIERRNHAR